LVINPGSHAAIEAVGSWVAQETWRPEAFTVSIPTTMRKLTFEVPSFLRGVGAPILEEWNSFRIAGACRTNAIPGWGRACECVYADMQIEINPSVASAPPYAQKLQCKNRDLARFRLGQNSHLSGKTIIVTVWYKSQIELPPLHAGVAWAVSGSRRKAGGMAEVVPDAVQTMMPAAPEAPTADRLL